MWQDTFVGDAVLKVAIREIREALADDPKSPRFIETAHRRGYRFIGQIGASARGRPAMAEEDGPSRPRLLHRRLASTVPADSSVATSRCRGCTDGSKGCAGGERQVVFVTGEAGIGKTTLLDTFVRRP